MRAWMILLLGAPLLLLARDTTTSAPSSARSDDQWLEEMAPDTAARALASATVAEAVKVRLAEHQRVALVAVAYDVGAPRFAGSQVPALVNAGRLREAALAMSDWFSTDRAVLARRVVQVVRFLGG